MPYSDPVKKAAWREKNNKKRRELRAVEINKREKELGYNTKQSLLWPKEKLSPIQAAWIAACIDCEGCLSLGSYWNKHRSSYNFHVNASVQMTDKSIPERLYDLCGGHVFYDERPIVKHKSIWQWHLGANGLRWLLPQIKDHLLIKNKQAVLLLEFLTLSKRGVSQRAEYNKRTQEIRSEMRRLNQRGFPTSPIGLNSEDFLENPR